MRVLCTLLILTGVLVAQESGKFSFQCTEDDVRDFGLTCDEDEPCQVFLELTEFEASGATLVLTGNLHTQTTTMFALLLVSDDGGKTWTEPAKRLPSAALEHIQFIDFQHGWVSGMMLDPLPRDPFFLITSDGGKSWRRRPMFEDTHYGAVLQFFFENDKAGELIIDRSQGNTKSFELYSTMTGGDGWEVKQVLNTQPKLAKARPRDTSTWRLTVNSSAKAYNLERRVAAASGLSWESIAQFPVLAGECK